MGHPVVLWQMFTLLLSFNLTLADLDLARAAEDPAFDLPLADEEEALPLEAEGLFLDFFLLPSSLSELQWVVFCTAWCKKNSCTFEFPAFLPPTNLGLPMHSPSALTEHVSLNLGRFFFARPCSWSTCSWSTRDHSFITYALASYIMLYFWMLSTEIVRHYPCNITLMHIIH